MNNDLRNLVKLYAKEHDLTFQEVLDVINIPFEFLTHVMKTKCDRNTLYFPSVRIIYWGVFHSPEWMRERIKKRIKIKNETI